ncbi:hypothetical protein RRG08_007416 [Elysia crispata]|uniref:Neurotransmitter-gated ion-channel ligand-binding domain-containing protein n=1 Tax=Elysia crispata TaxID=231223 RepID=A0AAE0ZYT0_9GAST|nr:hypothetical protein RRG08_007416 [Elysia crispata]
MRSLRTAGFYLLLALLKVSCDTTRDPLRDAYHQVKMDLLTHPYAVNKIPPHVNSTDNIDISLGFLPQQILFVNEVEMTVAISATVSIGWKEPSFAWDPTNHSIMALTVSAHDVWTPVLINSLSINTDDLVINMPPLLRIYHTGEIQTVTMVTMTVSCSFDMEWFPFDEQTCAFPFIPFNADSANVNTVSGLGPHVFLGFDNESKADWTWEEVIPRQANSLVQIRENIVKNYSYVSFEVRMKRRSVAFYLTNVIFPVAATAILTLGVFLIPASSGEKISYLISIFISTTVFLSSLSNTMPKGQGTCRFNSFIVAVTVDIILATAATMFVLHRYTKEQEQEQADEETTLTPSTEPKGRNSIFLPEATSLKQRSKVSTVNPAIQRTTQTIITNSSSALPPHPKLDAFQRSVSTPETSRYQHAPRLKQGMMGVRRFWTRGYRLTSSELDWMFLVVFTVTSIVVLVSVMHG